VNHASKATLVTALVVVTSMQSFSQAPAEIKGKLDARIKELRVLSTDPQVVSAVKTYNAGPPSPKPGK
jgi:ABC-type uncharacterized transport system YnjBCD ATPase subunit